jgi:hypothetical protein
VAEQHTADDTQIIVNLAQAAMQVHASAVDALPATNDTAFHKRADVVLSGLRKLQTALTDAARTDRSTLSVLAALGEVRSHYGSLMAVAAEAPGASLGQQLFVACRRAHLTADEVAISGGLGRDLLDELEAGKTPTADEARKIKDIIAALDDAVAGFTWPAPINGSNGGGDSAHNLENSEKEAIAEPVGS